jgi:ribosomal RNA methyltransferase Nop2
MKNTGCIFANDVKKERLRALQNNLQRMGVTNTVVTCRDGRDYSSIFPKSFDRVLVDVPSTSLGIISREPSIKTTASLADIKKNSLAQKELLLAAIDCTKVGGIIVYSNCSISPL